MVDRVMGSGAWRHSVNTHALQMYIYLENLKPTIMVTKSHSDVWIVTLPQTATKPQRRIRMDEELTGEEVIQAAFTIYKMEVQ